ncbi:MAG: glycerol-3-phosphate dehydrogenase/oxidase [Hahellaceae bacterium]|nr:glycerol-3-phosphate dehydrogenase/oxidase [Hahellaceae bacterium]
MRAIGRPGKREALIRSLQDDAGQTLWDLIIIGGGITGAGVLREATRLGLKVLLIEQRDFAWGTSSRSSKMVHGGLRYLGSGQVGLTRESVQERQRLLEEAPGLVEPLPFLMGHYKGIFPGPRIFNMLLAVYDFLAGRRNHRWWRKGISDFLAPGLRVSGLEGATQFGDAVTDDARLVLRTLQEAVAEGGEVLNYVEAVQLLREGAENAGSEGLVSGVTMLDRQTATKFDVRARCVVNATGAWTDELRAQLGAHAAVRPLRGSHLIVPGWRLPVAFAVSFFHQDDKRPVFAFPWEGVTVIGTTDLDHSQNMKRDASITQEEVSYLLRAANLQFPSTHLEEGDVIATYSGVRPVVSRRIQHSDADKTQPSKEKREHSVWDDAGMISVAGGKLTTFRLIALDVLKAAAPYLPVMSAVRESRIFKPVAAGEKPASINATQWKRLVGRYGNAATQLSVKQMNRIAHTDTLWAELEWVLENEMVVHLEDVLLRRTRIGLLLGQQVMNLLPDIRIMCQRRLGWDDARWAQEEYAYRQLVRHSYSLPDQEVAVTARHAVHAEVA